MCARGRSDTVVHVFVERPTEVQLGIYINSFYSISEQTMVSVITDSVITSHFIAGVTRKWGRAQRVARPACALCDCAFLTYLQTTEL